MDSSRLHHGVRWAMGAVKQRRIRMPARLFHASRCCWTESPGEFRAASPIRFTSDHHQFVRRRPGPGFPDEPEKHEHFRGRNNGNREVTSHALLHRVRVIPASASYFTALPKHTDDILDLSALLRKYQLLPTLSPGDGPTVKWKTRDDYIIELQEPVRAKSYNALVQLLKRLSHIHPSVAPEEVTVALEKYKRLVQPGHNRKKPIVVDHYGRARAVGRRKSSHAKVWLVEGDGQCLVNGRTLTNYFGRLHDRESAVWPLKATQRLDKYNVWALAKGGGTTGQADAITLAVAKALMAHEPDLKPALRRAGVVTRDSRTVERKKPGKLKARKMPAWVKR